MQRHAVLDAARHVDLLVLGVDHARLAAVREVDRRAAACCRSAYSRDLKRAATIGSSAATDSMEDLQRWRTEREAGAQRHLILTGACFVRPAFSEGRHRSRWRSAFSVDLRRVCVLWHVAPGVVPRVVGRADAAPDAHPARPHRPGVRTRPFQGRDPGSNPGGDASLRSPPACRSPRGATAGQASLRAKAAPPKQREDDCWPERCEGGRLLPFEFTYERWASQSARRRVVPGLGLDVRTLIQILEWMPEHS